VAEAGVTPASGPPKTLDELHEYLRAAVQLELSVIPPYLCGLYTMHADSNLESSLILRSVVTEEMLHLTLAANVLMAVGGDPPRLASRELAPEYPLLLVIEEGLPPPERFVVHLLPFSPPAVETFLKIENPAHPPSAMPELAATEAMPTHVARLGFATVGAFYAAVEQGLCDLTESLGEQAVFSGDPRFQVEPAYYYAGGGSVAPVRHLEGALAALEEIVDQGEGDLDAPYDEDGDLAHYYRFLEIARDRRYTESDPPDDPTGAPLGVDYEAVYPMRADPKTSDYPSAELRAASDACNRTYTELLRVVDGAFATTDQDAKGDALIAAVGKMLELRNAAGVLVRNPIPDGSGEHAGPTFELVPDD
jgi:Ferritin-like